MLHDNYILNMINLQDDNLKITRIDNPEFASRYQNKLNILKNRLFENSGNKPVFLLSYYLQFKTNCDKV